MIQVLNGQQNRQKFSSPGALVREANFYYLLTTLSLAPFLYASHCSLANLSFSSFQLLGYKIRSLDE